MIPYFLFSETIQHQNQPNELEVVKRIFGTNNVGSLITRIPADRLVVPRFRFLPFGKELEQEIINQDSVLVNSYREHRKLADIFYWAPLLEGLTPPVYHEWETPYLGAGEWFVKGETNSIKNRWFDCCYAPTTEDLPRVVRNNKLDTYVGVQEVAVRPYQHYREIGVGVNGKPVFNEKRCFVFNKQVVSSGYYWSSYPELEQPALSETLFNRTLNQVVHRVGDIAPFFVVDLAEYPDGSWGVVELNDATMCGLSENAPETVWGGFYNEVVNLLTLEHAHS